MPASLMSAEAMPFMLSLSFCLISRILSRAVIIVQWRLKSLFGEMAFLELMRGLALLLEECRIERLAV